MVEVSAPPLLSGGENRKDFLELKLRELPSYSTINVGVLAQTMLTNTVRIDESDMYFMLKRVNKVEFRHQITFKVCFTNSSTE